MKKLFVLFALLAFIGTASYSQATKPVEKAKTELASTGKDLVKAVDSTLKDSAAMASIVTEVKEAAEEIPEKGSPWYVWFMWIFGVLYFIAGVVASHWPTKKNLWWLRIFPIIVKFMVTFFIAPANRKKDGGEHSV